VRNAPLGSAKKRMCVSADILPELGLGLA